MYTHPSGSFPNYPRFEIGPNEENFEVKIGKTAAREERNVWPPEYVLPKLIYHECYCVSFLRDG